MDAKPLEVIANEKICGKVDLHHRHAVFEMNIQTGV